ncbi:hypothetical protein ABPG75_009931 [Micractinium tetrahymenae]
MTCLLATSGQVCLLLNLLCLQLTMADYANVSGGYYNGIWTLVPEECHARVDPNSATQQGSEAFLINRWREYVQSLMVDLAPGIVLGSISAAGFLIFVVWAVVRWRRRGSIRAARLAKREARQAAKAAGTAAGTGGKAGEAEELPPPQFLTQAHGELEQPEKAQQQPQQPAPRWWQRAWSTLTAGRVLKWLIVLLALATMAVCGWGLAESIYATNGLVDSFWLLVERARDLVLELEGAMASLGESLGEVAGTLSTVQGVLQKIVDTVQGIPVIGGLIGKALPMDKIEELVGPKAESAISGIESGAALINGTLLPVINDKVLPAIDSITQHEGWTTNLQDTWRYVLIAVLFGLLIAMSGAVAAACLRMRRGVLATSLVALLWLLNAVVMFLGLGLLNGAKSVANDACLYSEDYVSRLVEQRLEGDTQKLVSNALDYYFGRTDLVDVNGAPLLTNGTEQCDAALTAALLRQVAGIELHEALVYAWQAAELLPSISGLLAGINLPTIPLVNFDLDAIKVPVMEASDQLQGLLEDICNVTLLLVRENAAWPLYVDAKTYVCCDLTTAVHNVWVPWTVAGVLALVLSFFASLRVVTSTLRPHGQAAQGGGGIEGSMQLAEMATNCSKAELSPAAADLVPAPGEPPAAWAGAAEQPAVAAAAAADGALNGAQQ